MENRLILLLFVLIFILADIPFLIVIIRLAVLSARKTNEKFAEIAGRINGRLKTGFLQSPSVTADYPVPLKISYLPGGKNTPPFLRILVLRKPPFVLYLRKEGWDTRLGKKLKLAREVVINVPDFDREFFIRTDDRLRCPLYLGDSERRNIIRELFNAGWEMSFERNRILLQKKLIFKTDGKETPKGSGLRLTDWKQAFSRALNCRPISTVRADEISGVIEKVDRLSRDFIGAPAGN